MKKTTQPSAIPPDGSERPDMEAGRAALAWAVGQGKGDDVMRQVAAQVRRNQRRRMRVAAAGIAVLLVIGIFWQTQQADDMRVPAVPASAVVTKPETQVLPDGSVVELNHGARIAVNFGPGSTGMRRVVLKRGEAHFQVTKNPLRPFVVVAGGVEVRAVGTAFSVQLGAQAVEVLVTEGRVAVDQPASAPPSSAVPSGAAPAPEPLAFINAGHRVMVELTPLSATTTPPPVVTVSETELRERLAWRVPLLELSGTPLAEVIPMFNRYSADGRNMRLVLAEHALGELQVSGVLRADNTAALLRLLRNEFDIVAEPRGDTLVLRRP